MGQYFYVVNLDKRQYLHPHDFGDGLKLLEFGASGSGTMCGLALLLRQSNEDGGGDFHHADEVEIVGSWAGDRITIVGDYDESGLYHEAHSSYENVSKPTIEAMRKDEWLSKDLTERGARY